MSWTDYIQVICLKFRYFHVDCSVLELTYVADELFQHFLKDVVHVSEKVKIFVREGGTPINRCLIEAARDCGLSSITIFTNSFFTPEFPIYTDTVAAPNGHSIPDEKEHPFIKKSVIFNDNPFIDWRDIYQHSIKNNTVGVISDTGFLGYKGKLLTDKLMVRAITHMPELRGLLRIHPQEMSSPRAKLVYEQLLSGQTQISIDESDDISSFFYKISVMVTNSESSTVEQALTCGIPVVIVNSPGASLNKDIVSYAGNLVRLCENEFEISAAVSYFQHLKIEERKKLWDQFIAKMDYSMNKRLSIDEAIKLVYV